MQISSQCASYLPRGRAVSVSLLYFCLASKIIPQILLIGMTNDNLQKAYSKSPYSIAAVNWIINQAKSTGLPSVINISVKFPPNDLLDAVVTDAVNNGVHVVVSAGNAASDASSQV